MIHLVRHGETAYNRDGLGLGREDVPLTELGLAQAEAVAGRLAGLPIRRILTSPLSRASHIAELAGRAHGLPVQRHEALTELHVGETEGLTFAQMRLRYPDYLREWAGPEGWTARMPGGESIQDIGVRLAPLVLELKNDHEGDILVVSHNFTLRALMCLMLGIELSRFRSFELGLASLSTLTVRNGRVGVRCVNDVCHFASLNLA